jgi:hypothetical protein
MFAFYPEIFRHCFYLLNSVVVSDVNQSGPGFELQIACDLPHSGHAGCSAPRHFTNMKWDVYATRVQDMCYNYYRVVMTAAEDTRFTAVYIIVVVFFALALLMWIWVWSNIPPWFVALIFSMNCSLILETILRTHGVTQSRVDLALSILLFCVLLFIASKARTTIILLLCALLMYLAYNWTHVLATQILLPACVAAVFAIMVWWWTDNLFQVCCRLISGFTSSWVIVYSTRFFLSGGDEARLDDSAHDVLDGPACISTVPCAYNLVAVVFLAVTHVLMASSKMCTKSRLCAFCWVQDEDDEETEEERKPMKPPTKTTS